MSLYTDLLADLGDAFQTDLEAPSVTFTRRAAPTTDLVEGTLTPGSATTFGLRALIIPVDDSTVTKLDAQFMEGVRGQANVRLALAVSDGNAGHVPLPGDTANLYHDGKAWQVFGCTPVNLDGATNLVFVVGFKL